MKTKLLTTAAGLAAIAFLLSPLPVNAQPKFRSPANDGWYLQSSAHEPCWSIANPIACNPHVKPGSWVNFRHDPTAAQSYWSY